MLALSCEFRHHRAQLLHLMRQPSAAGMIASLSPLPVIGVPVKSSNSIDGWDSILSILQMPGGVPVATVALNGAKNAGILAAQILGSSDEAVQKKIIDYKNSLKEKVIQSSKQIKK